MGFEKISLRLVRIAANVTTELLKDEEMREVLMRMSQMINNPLDSSEKLRILLMKDNDNIQKLKWIGQSSTHVSCLSPYRANARATG